jgi:hypothetical protein
MWTWKAATAPRSIAKPPMRPPATAVSMEHVAEQP